MDKKSTLILLVSFALLFVLNTTVNRLYPPLPAPAATNRVSVATNSHGVVVTNLAEAPVASISQAAAPLHRETNSAITPLPPPSGTEQTVTIENENGRYVFTSRGGGLKSAALKKYPETVGCKTNAAAGTNALASLNTGAPLPGFAIIGGPGLEGDANFALEKIDNGVRAVKSLPNGLKVIKEFRLSTNYYVKATVRTENHSAEAIRLPSQEWVIGTSTPIGTGDESLYLGFQWYDGKTSARIGHAWFDNRTLGCFPGRPRTEYLESNTNVLWAAVYNQFFTIVAIPQAAASQVAAREVKLPPPSKEVLAGDAKAVREPHGIQAAFVYPPINLAGGNATEHRFDIFAGPKEYHTLSRLGRDLDLVMDFGGFWGFFPKALLLSMNGLHHGLGLGYGLAIIVITVIIKAVFWPLTLASTRSMKRMAALQPQMKALQEKYKDDPKKMNTKLMEFMKENKVSPLGGCLPMVLQIPVFIGFYKMLQTAIELRGASFLWACDLSRADTIFVIPGIDFPVNPMPLMMGATMLWQAQLTPPSPGMDPMQQKMMKYMPLMMMVFLYKFSAGLTLYWTVQNLLTILQMKLTRDKIPGADASKTQSPALALKKKR